MRLRDVFPALPDVVPFVKKYSKAVNLHAPDPALIYGIEIELEDTCPDWRFTGFMSKVDGSLRNGGMEYVSHPMTYSQIGYVLGLFYSPNKTPVPVTEKNLSERCSIHVHANCQDLTVEEIKTICLLYQVLERTLFGFIGDDRANNIFCVPWYETTINYNFIEQCLVLGRMNNIRNWHKYTALNLLSLSQFGTIEFRHMGGIIDLHKIMQWLRLIGHLFATGRTKDFKTVKDMIINLNTNSEYLGFMTMVFKEDIHIISPHIWQPNLTRGVLDLKYLTLRG